jgi:hypothetical protein
VVLARAIGGIMVEIYGDCRFKNLPIGSMGNCLPAIGATPTVPWLTLSTANWAD